jgi:hypothetical protein
MLNKAGNEGTREQGNKKTGEQNVRRPGLVQQRAVILSEAWRDFAPCEVEGSAVAFRGADAPKERMSSQ